MRTRPWTSALLIAACVLGLPGCAVVTVAGVAAGVAVGVATTVVGTGVSVAGKVVGAGVSAVTPDTSTP